MSRTPGFTAKDTLLAITTVAFDIAALELYLPLVNGGTVVIAREEEVRDGLLLRERLTETQATMLQATPSTWRMLLETDFRPAAGFKMLCGGEALRRDHADRLLRLGGELWNMYGPTETTIWSSCGRVGVAGAITVGRPIANTAFHILDEQDQPVIPGDVGQLHIGGLGVARGYVNREDLSAQKFIPNPFGPGRLYRTGDIARLTASNEFEILGRADQQVKLRGFRIELGEIEALFWMVNSSALWPIMSSEKVIRYSARLCSRLRRGTSQNI
jgi:non-ribosomal peptide synthetase component F